MKILGISGLYHDSAAALIVDGKVVNAVQEERFTRRKNDKSFPVNAIEFCLKNNGISGKDLDAVVFYDNPLLTLDRFLENCIAVGDANKTLINNNYQSMFADKLWIHRTVKEYLGEFGIDSKLLVCEHHVSHAAYAFFESPYEDAAIMTVDGVGEWVTTTLGVGNGTDIKILKQINYPDSLGLLYSAFTYFCGFKVNSGEYKLMGLAPYGEPKFVELIKQHLIDIKDDGSYKLNMDMFSYQFGETMTDSKFEELFGCCRREPEAELTKIYFDIAASIQVVTEEIVLKMAKHLKDITGKKKLCLCGGVALNCVANGALLREKIFEDIFIPPAAGDSGSCVGAALYAYYAHFNNERIATNERNRVYLGPDFSDKIEKQILDGYSAKYKFVENSDDLLNEVASALNSNKVVGFFNGAMEFGPRALGARSILANPQDPEMQSKLNLNIKYRESFRPFAPSVLVEKISEYFDLDRPSPYMLMVAPVNNEIRYEVAEHHDDILREVSQVRSTIPAVTHVDYSARIQSVSERDNKKYYDLINKFYELSGCAVLVNTSFNVRGEPIVCTPADAYECFMRTEMDVLVIDNYILYKEEQPYDEQRWKKQFELD